MKDPYPPPLNHFFQTIAAGISFHPIRAEFKTMDFRTTRPGSHPFPSQLQGLEHSCFPLFFFLYCKTRKIIVYLLLQINAAVPGTQFSIHISYIFTAADLHL